MLTQTHDPSDPLFFITLPEREEQMRQVRRVVSQDTTVLLTGETGTGKTLLARHIHQLSPRRSAPFLIVDCSALSASLIESEMFGHIKGAFTGADRNRPGKFAAVGRGTLVLDEINSLPGALQSKLLRVVEERVFEPVGSNQSQPLEARIIAISNATLEQEVAQGRFRADLYYRLNVVGFGLKPLRECRRAIAPLANQFLHDFTRHSGISGIAGEALAALEDYHWPGNIRQLRNVIERPSRSPRDRSSTSATCRMRCARLGCRRRARRCGAPSRCLLPPGRERPRRTSWNASPRRCIDTTTIACAWRRNWASAAPRSTRNCTNMACLRGRERGLSCLQLSTSCFAIPLAAWREVTSHFTPGRKRKGKTRT